MVFLLFLTAHSDDQSWKRMQQRCRADFELKKLYLHCTHLSQCTEMNFSCIIILISYWQYWKVALYIHKIATTSSLTTNKNCHVTATMHVVGKNDECQCIPALDWTDNGVIHCRDLNKMLSLSSPSSHFPTGMHSSWKDSSQQMWIMCMHKYIVTNLNHLNE